MLGRASRRTLSCVVVLLLGGAVPLGAQPLADRVPGDALVYAGWQGANALGPAYEQSRLKAVLDAAQFQQLIDEFVPRFLAVMGKEDPDAREAAKVLGAIGGPVWRYPSAFYLGPLDLTNPREPMPRLAVYVQAGAEAPRLLEQVKAVLPKEGEAPVPISVSADGGLVMLQVGKFPAAPAGRLSDNANFKAAMGQVLKSPAAACYFDIEAIVQTANEAVQKGPDAKAKTEWPKLRDAMGLSGLRRLVAVAGFDGRDWGTQAFVSAPAPRVGLLSLLDGPAISDELLKAIPRSATVAGAVRMDGSKLLQVVRDTVGQLDPKALKQMDQALAVAREQLGVDLQKDLLEPLGEQWGYYINPSDSGYGFLGLTLVNRLRDPAKMEQALGKLEQLANAIIKQQATEKFSIQIRQQEIEGVKVHALPAPGVTPCWTIREGNLYMALYPQVLVPAARHVADKGPSLLTNAEFVAARQRLGAGPQLGGFQFADLPRTGPESYQLLLVLSRLVLGTGEVMGAPAPLMFPPAYAKLAPHLAPMGSAWWMDDTGLHYKAVEPFPGSQLMSAGGIVSAAMGQAAPIAVAVGLPALAKARQNAERVKCSSNLRQIGMGCIIYANDRKNQFPADLGTMAVEVDFQPEAFLCPMSKSQPPANWADMTKEQKVAWVNANGQYVYIGKGTTAEQNPENVIAHDKPDNHGGEGMNVVFADGSVEWLTIEEAQKRIDATAARKAKPPVGPVRDRGGL